MVPVGPLSALVALNSLLQTLWEPNASRCTEHIPQSNCMKVAKTQFGHNWKNSNIFLLAKTVNERKTNKLNFNILANQDILVTMSIYFDQSFEAVLGSLVPLWFCCSCGLLALGLSSVSVAEAPVLRFMCHDAQTTAGSASASHLHLTTFSCHLWSSLSRNHFYHTLYGNLRRGLVGPDPTPTSSDWLLSWDSLDLGPV